MKAPGAILALALGKGKDGDSDEEPLSKPDPEVEKPSTDEYKSLFVDAAKAGDWEAAFDAVKQCLAAKE